MSSADKNLEIERKFLVKEGVDWKQYVHLGDHLKQGYLKQEDDSLLRIRLVNDNKGYLTMKTHISGFTREEFETEISAAFARMLLKKCGDNFIDKVRYEFIHEGYGYTLDHFSTGVVLVELELESENIEVNLPDWLGKEVTYDSEYFNSNMIPRNKDVSNPEVRKAELLEGLQLLIKDWYKNKFSINQLHLTEGSQADIIDALEALGFKNSSTRFSGHHYECDWRFIYIQPGVEKLSLDVRGNINHEGGYISRHFDY